jgi:hypothetical protein
MAGLGSDGDEGGPQGRVVLGALRAQLAREAQAVWCIKGGKGSSGLFSLARQRLSQPLYRESARYLSTALD